MRVIREWVVNDGKLREEFRWLFDDEGHRDKNREDQKEEDIHTRPIGGNLRPATRVDNWVIFEGGYSRRLTLWERLRIFLGRDVRVSP